jgi:hypothetical protein
VADNIPVTEPARLARDLRTPKAAAVAGILFSLMLGTVIVMMSSVIPPQGAGRGAWITNASSRSSVAFALSLIPFAGIAFLWFIGVIRNHLGDREDKFFATVFLGSGLLLVGILFTAAAVMASVLATYEQAPTISPDTLRIAEILASTLLVTFGARMAAVFTLSVTTVGTTHTARARLALCLRDHLLRVARGHPARPQADPAGLPALGSDPEPEHLGGVDAATGTRNRWPPVSQALAPSLAGGRLAQEGSGTPRAVTVLFHESCRLASLPARHLLVVIARSAHRRRPGTNRPTKAVAAGHHLCDDRLHHGHDSAGRHRTCAKHLRSRVLRKRGGPVHRWRPGTAEERHRLRTVVLEPRLGQFRRPSSSAS